MNEYAYYNGVFTPYNAACIPLSDRSIFFSDAIYDVVIGRGKNPYQLDLHLDRLFKNAELIGLANPPSKSMIKEAIQELIEIADADTFMLYIQLSSDAEKRTHSRCSRDTNLLVTITECELPTELGEIRAITLPDRRHGMCDVKTTNLLSAVLSVEEAKRRGADIAIFHKHAFVTECSYANIAILQDGCLFTHPLDSDILPGITQENLVTACSRLGVPHLSRTFTLDEMFSADAVMITSTTKLIKLCTEIDGIRQSSSSRELVQLLFEELKRDLHYKTEANVSE